MSYLCRLLNHNGYSENTGLLTADQISEISKAVSDVVADGIRKEVSEKLKDFQKLEVK